MEGFIKRTPGGRMVTELGVQASGRDDPTKATSWNPTCSDRQHLISNSYDWYFKIKQESSWAVSTLCTVGHESIVRRALPLFDKDYHRRGVQRAQAVYTSAETRVRNIQVCIAWTEVEVKMYDRPTVDFALSWEAPRSSSKVYAAWRDFEYEREQADINRRIGGIETVTLLCQPGMESISKTVWCATVALR